jgi:hypothetical protein
MASIFEQIHPINHKLIDKILLSTVDKANNFYNEFQDNTDTILYWYDMNKKMFINKRTIDYNSKIIKKYNFNLYLEDHSCYDKSKKGVNINYNIMLNNRICYNYDIMVTGNEGKYTTNKQKMCKLKLYIDDHLNIIIPEIKTIIINNYSPFPLYALYAIHNEYLDQNENLIYNKYNEEGFNVYTYIIKEFNNYLTSNEQRNKFNDGKLFEEILYFIVYDEMIIDIKKHLNFMSSLSFNNKNDISNFKILIIYTHIILVIYSIFIALYSS